MRLTRWNVRAALQTTYADEDIPSEIRVTYAPHPLVGKNLRVVARRRKGHDFYWRVVLPDGSHAELPSSWTDPCSASPSEQVAQVKTRATPAALRELMGLLGALVATQPPRQTGS
jgi:hypothetical protein